jgi:O-antigen ligase
LGVRVSPPFSVVVRRYILYLLGLWLVCIAVIAFLVASGQATVTLARISLLLSSPYTGGSGIRLQLFVSAIDAWLKAPLYGHGIGAFPILAGFGDIRSYPHNLILEILAELGLGGLFLFSAIVIYALRALGPLSTIRRDPLRILLLMLFANVFFNAMVSGDIPDNRIVFAVLGLMTLPKGGKNG